jgi:hypothetical protein
LAWDGLLPDQLYYVRVTQQLPSGAWEASPTFLLTTTSACAQPFTLAGGTGVTTVSSNAICQRGVLSVTVTANATGTLQLTRVRVTSNGASIFDAAVSGQGYSNTFNAPAGLGAQSLVVVAEDSSGQPPATAALTPICI